MPGDRDHADDVAKAVTCTKLYRIIDDNTLFTIPGESVYNGDRYLHWGFVCYNDCTYEVNRIRIG